MIVTLSLATTVLSTLIASTVGASTCPAIQPMHPVSVAAGYTFQTVANGLGGARSIVFDSAGHLLVLRSGFGIVALTLKDGGDACVTLASSKTVLTNPALNHGLALSADGKTLYASSSSVVASWSYNPTTMTVSPTNTTIINDMYNTDHSTRTLYMSTKKPGTLLVSRGSNANLDPGAGVLSNGRSQVKAFDLDALAAGKTYDFSTAGTLLGWGLRNSVGVTENPLTGGIFTVENSQDDIVREGKDVHINNPGEELNFHGYLNGTKSTYQGANFGYPDCLAAFAPGELPDNQDLTVGSQFVLNPTKTINDSWCEANAKSPIMTFQAHQAPLDIKFTADGLTAYVTFHGSWDRQPPIGYKLTAIPFTTSGHPVPRPNTTTGTTDVLWNPNTGVCPGSCFRPVGLAWDSRGRLFVSSDATGEVVVVVGGNELSGNSSSMDQGEDDISEWFDETDGNGDYGLATSAAGSPAASASPTTKSAASQPLLTKPSIFLVCWSAFIALTISFSALRVLG